MKQAIALFLFLTTFVSNAQLNEIRELLKDKPPTEETATWLCDTAFTFYRNDPKLTQQIAELALEKAIEWDADTSRAKANHVIGISYWARDVYDSAITHYLEAVKYYEQIGLQRGVATINMNIGVIYDDLGEPERGKPYQLRSLEDFKELNDSINLGRGLNNLGVLYSNIDQPDSAIYYFRECMKIRMALNDSIGVARILNNIADAKMSNIDTIEFRKVAYESAYEDLTESLNYLKEGEDANLMATILSNLGFALIKLDRIEEAEPYLKQSEELAIEVDSKIRLQQIYTYYANLYTEKNDYKQALDYYIKSTKLDKEQRNAEVRSQIDLLNIKYETERRERELAELEREKAEERGIRNAVIISGSSVIIIIVLLLFNVLSKRRRDRQLAELKMQKLNEQIDLKNKEISSYTLSFIQKNQLMDELKGQINELKKQSDTDTNRQLTRINKIVDETFRSDEEWKTFQITFDQMHDGFFAVLKEQYPDLGNAELKLCALLRLNMNLKESARILGISPDSVKTARYRLRKKLGLKTEDNLVNFLIMFEQEYSMQKV